MTDFQVLYRQSLVQIQKQKDQIKRLEEQIRERCQSYLIHSSRYKSRVREGQVQANGELKSSRIDTPVKSQQKRNLLDLSSNIIDVSIQNKEDFGGGEKNAQIKVETLEVQAYQSQEKSKAQNSLKIQIERQLFREEESIKKSQAEQRAQIEASFREELRRWEQIVSGLKDRISSLQSQKSEQSLKISELQEKVSQLQNQSKTNQRIRSQNQKRESKSQDQRESSEASELQKILDRVWGILQSRKIVINDDNNEEKVKKLIEYIDNAQESFQEKTQKKEKCEFDTPYGKIKNSNYQRHEGSDIYQQEDIEKLKKKCKQLEAELSNSRMNNFRSPAILNQEVQDQEEQLACQSPYIIQEQLEKPNDSYVKRIFVRKKVVKRNLSAMILKTPSKTKQESKSSMIAQLTKLKQHLEKSKNESNEKQIRSLSKKIDRLQTQIIKKQEKIEQKSDDESSIARTSGVSHGFTEIVQIETEGPGYKNYTAHILGLSKKDKNGSEIKRRQNLFG